MKLYTSNGVKLIVNHPTLNVPVQAPAYPKFAPDNHKLVVEKRQIVKKQA